LSTTEKNDRSRVQYEVAPERMPLIADERMTPSRRKRRRACRRPAGRGERPFVALLRSPDFMSRVQKVGEYIRFVCPLDKRINEFAAIIAARHWNQQFEWWAHYRQALEAGLKREIADAVREGRRPTGMAEDEEIVYDLLTEVLVNKGASDATYRRRWRSSASRVSST